MPAETTESLRRVSRQWKHASEGNNKDAAIERLGWGGEGREEGVGGAGIGFRDLGDWQQICTDGWRRGDGGDGLWFFARRRGSRLWWTFRASGNAVAVIFLCCLFCLAVWRLGGKGVKVNL